MQLGCNRPNPPDPRSYPTIIQSQFHIIDHVTCRVFSCVWNVVKSGRTYPFVLSLSVSQSILNLGPRTRAPRSRSYSYNGVQVRGTSPASNTRTIRDTLWNTTAAVPWSESRRSLAKQELKSKFRHGRILAADSWVTRVQDARRHGEGTPDPEWRASAPGTPERVVVCWELRSLRTTRRSPPVRRHRRLHRQYQTLPRAWGGSTFHLARDLTRA